MGEKSKLFKEEKKKGGNLRMGRMGVKGRISRHFPTDVMWVQITLRHISCCNCTANANILMS